MKTLLRSTFLADPNDKQDLLFRNYLDLYQSGLGFDTPEDNALWAFIQRFVQQHSHVPDYSTLVAHFKHVREDRVSDRLEELRILKTHGHGDFQARLEIKANERRVRVVSELLKEGKAVGLLLDQRVPDGEPVEFLGQTVVSVGLLRAQQQQQQHKPPQQKTVLRRDDTLNGPKNDLRDEHSCEKFVSVSII